MTDEPGVKLVHASLSRMGTMSISAAYQVLGLNPHHVHMSSASSTDWHAFDRAVDGKWPHVPGADPTRRPFTREDWEAVRHSGGEEWDFFTDFFGHFSPDIIRAYPEAKVVIVQRDFESWWPSYVDRCIDSINAPSIRLLNIILHAFQRVTAIDSCAKQYFGFFGVTSLEDINRVNGRKAYDAFFEEVRALVPPERRLEYKISDGWEPLCKFLDRPVPDVPFPQLNSREEHRRKGYILIWGMYGGMATLAAGIAVAGSWYLMR